MRWLSLTLIAAGISACSDPGAPTPVDPPAQSRGDCRCGYRFEPFDVPAEFGDFTSVFGISNTGAMVGNFRNRNGGADGFLFQKRRFTDVFVPGADPEFRGSLSDVSDDGLAVGSYTEPITGVGRTFTRDRQGTQTTLPDGVPGAIVTEGSGINNAGTIVGFFIDQDFGFHGFVYSGATLTPFDYPGATGTFLTGINNHDQITGFWFGEDGQRHGFLLDGEAATPVEVPGAVNTRPESINDRGQVVGHYDDAQGVRHGFVLRDGVFTTLDFPGAFNTELYGINNRGVIVGTYDDDSRGLAGYPVSP